MPHARVVARSAVLAAVSGRRLHPRCPRARRNSPSHPAPSKPTRETTRLNEWFDARYEEQLDFSPLTKTQLGRKDDYDQDRRLLGEPAANSAARVAAREPFASSSATSIAALLTPEAQTSYDLWLYGLERAEAAEPFRRRGYMFNQMQGPHTGLPQSLINFHRVDDESDMAAYVSRIGEVGRAIGQALERAQARGRRRRARAAVRLRRRDRSSRARSSRARRSAARASRRSTPTRTRRSRRSSPAARSTAARGDELRAAAATALTERFKPAYEAIIAFAEADRANSDEVATGVWKLPDGPAYYTRSSRREHDDGDDGRRDSRRSASRRSTASTPRWRRSKRQVGFDGTLQEFFASLRSNPRFLFPNTDEGREGYLQTSRDFYAGVEARLPQYFGILPKAGLVVKRVEAFRERPGRAALHAGHAGRLAAGHVLRAPHRHELDAEESRWRASRITRAFPGHHMQIAIAQELTRRADVPHAVPAPRPTSKAGGSTPSGSRKRWARYQDPYSDFGRLGAEIWRAIRLVVDTGLHSKGWTEEQAVQYFLANGPTSEGQVRAEIRRYLVMPGQATSYKVGMLKIHELRERARTALGERFDIRGFHDTVLGGGALPLSILERRVDDWIAANSSR